MDTPVTTSALDTRCARCGTCESTTPLHEVRGDLFCADCLARGPAVSESASMHVHFQDDVDIDPKARVAIDVIKFVCYLVVIIVSAWSELVRAMAQGVFIADAMIWFFGMLHEFTQRVSLGFAEAAGYILVFVLFGAIAGGPTFSEDPGLLALTILCFMTTFVIKGVWTAHRKLGD